MGATMNLAGSLGRWAKASIGEPGPERRQGCPGNELGELEEVALASSSGCALVFPKAALKILMPRLLPPPPPTPEIPISMA